MYAALAGKASTENTPISSNSDSAKHSNFFFFISIAPYISVFSYRAYILTHILYHIDPVKATNIGNFQLVACFRTGDGFVKFQFIEQIALTGNGILRMPGKRIATSVAEKQETQSGVILSETKVESKDLSAVMTQMGNRYAVDPSLRSG